MSSNPTNAQKQIREGGEAQSGQYLVRKGW
ncbi:hypothetical protein LINPERHAP1_LOCUS30759, partial [Linum perenne]